MIRVIGDSHIMLFAGVNDSTELQLPVDYQHNPTDRMKEFDTYYINLLRAYHICTETNHPYGKDFFDLVEHLPKEDTILVSAGEIDCRGPILNIARRQNREIENVVEECVGRYISGIKSLRDRGWNFILYAPIPNQYTEKVVKGATLPDEMSPVDWCVSKDIATDYFDELIKASGITVVSLVDWIIENSVEYDSRYWKDTNHLNEGVWGQLLKEFSNIGINLTLEKRP